MSIRKTLPFVKSKRAVPWEFPEIGASDAAGRCEEWMGLGRT